MLHVLKRKTSGNLIWAIVPLLAASIYPFIAENYSFIKTLTIALLIYTLFFSVVIHELSHGLAALAGGDTTARDTGRLTLNPVAHFSIIGSFLLPLILYLVKAPILFGFAKPVPFNPVNLKHYPRDQVLIALAGPFSNFILSYVFFNLFLLTGIILKTIYPDMFVGIPEDLFASLDIPKSPLSGLWFVLVTVSLWGALINISLGIFNLIPIPPLDGSWILRALLPRRAQAFMSKLQLWSFIIIIIAIQFKLLNLFLYPILGVFSIYSAIIVSTFGY